MDWNDVYVIKRKTLLIFTKNNCNLNNDHIMNYGQYLIYKNKYENDIETIEFDYSLENYKVQSFKNFFKDYIYLTKILNIEILNSKYVVNCESMFENCSNLIYLNLKWLISPNKLQVKDMFKGCDNLRYLFLPSNIDRKKAQVPSTCLTKEYNVYTDAISRAKAVIIMTK